MSVEALLDKINNNHGKRDIIHGRLLNWGRWLRYDDTFAKLGYPTQAPFIFSPRKGKLIADLDAEHIEWVVSSLHLSGFPLGVLYAFILKIEYAEKPDGLMGTVDDRAKDVRRRFKRRCAVRTYYYHLAKAKKAVETLADTMQ